MIKQKMVNASLIIISKNVPQMKYSGINTVLTTNGASNQDSYSAIHTHETHWTIEPVIAENLNKH